MTADRRLACAAGLSLLVAGLTGCGGDEPVIGVGETLPHEHVSYTVESVRRLRSIGAVRARGEFVLVRLVVANHARRITHAWDNAVAYLVDARSRRYENDPARQRLLDAVEPFGWQATHVTGAGERAATTLVFDVPVDAAPPVDLRVRGELLATDLLEGARFRRTRVRLF